MGDALLWSLVASVVLTVVLNVGVRLFASTRRRGRSDHDPQAPRWSSEAPSWPSLLHPPPASDDGVGGGGSDDGRAPVRFFVPWKAVLIGSIILTVVVNALAGLS